MTITSKVGAGETAPKKSKKNTVTGGESDLGITDGAAAAPTHAEALYAGRIAAGDHPRQGEGDPAFTPGVRQALVCIRPPASDADVLDEARHSQVTALALQMGYDGPVTIGALEDGIRFYQRRTVEACLELGKRLLLLKEVSQIGKEFESRLELLGFSKSNAYRFMQAAAKTAKSANLTLLATQVKSVSAFLELITHDEDSIAEIAEMDDIDCLSATELKNRLRQSEQSVNRLKSDLSTAQSRLAVEAKTLPPPLLSREADKHLHQTLNAEAMGAAALDLLKRQIAEMESGGGYLEERAMTLHSCLTALASRVSLALTALKDFADLHGVNLPPRPQMVVNENMARDYLEAHTGYINTAIELAQKALIARSDVIGRGPGRPKNSTNKPKGSAV